MNIRREVLQHERETRVGAGWFRGPATVNFDCDDCDRPIAKGSDVAASKSRNGGALIFLHGDCYDRRYSNG